MMKVPRKKPTWREETRKRVMRDIGLTRSSALGLLRKLYRLEDEATSVHIGPGHEYSPMHRGLLVVLASAHWGERFNTEEKFREYLSASGLPYDKTGTHRDCFTHYYFERDGICALFKNSSIPF